MGTLIGMLVAVVTVAAVLSTVAVAVVGALVGVIGGLGGAAVGVVGALVGVIGGLGGAAVGVVGAVVGVIVGAIGMVVHVCVRLVRPVALLLLCLLPILLVAKLATSAGMTLARDNGPNTGVHTYPTQDPGRSVPASAERATIAAVDGLADHANSAASSQALPARQQLFSDVVDTWRADVYPSDKAAVRSLITRIGEELNDLTEGQEPKLIQVQGNVRRELLMQAVDILKPMHPRSRITSARTDDRAERLDDRQSVVVHMTAGQDGQALPFLCVETVGWQHWTTDQVGVDRRLWVADYTTFANMNPGKDYIVAVSQRPATSAAEAERDALAVAGQSLQPRISERMSRRTWIPSDVSADSQQWVRSRIVAELPDSQMIADRFVQRLQAPYGDVWQTSLLLDVSPGKVADLAGRLDSLLERYSRGARSTFLSIAGMIALVCLVYAVLNSLTRGYFVWSLRALALALAAGGVFLVLLLRT